MAMDCKLYKDLAYFFTSMAVLWTVAALWWCCAVYGYRRAHTRPLHRIVVFVVLFKALYDLFTASILATCPFEGSKAEYLNLAVSSSFTLFYTFLYTLFLLISKGYCVTRYLLDRSEVTVVAVTMGAVYLGYSAYTIEPSQLFPLICCLIVAVFLGIGRYGLATMKLLRQQIGNLRRSGIQDLVQPAVRKLKMMQTFAWCFVAYFLSEITGIIIGGIANSASLSFVTYTAEEVCESAALLVLLWTFRPKFHGEFSTLPLLDSATEVHRIPPMFTFKVTAEDLTSLASLSDTSPVLILPPAPASTEEPFLGIEIGQLLLDSRRPQPRLFTNVSI